VADATVIVDEAGIIVLLNGRAEEMFDYARDVLVGQPIEALVPRGAPNKRLYSRLSCEALS
jgi:PAS domain S-box-containing protein